MSELFRQLPDRFASVRNLLERIRNKKRKEPELTEAEIIQQNVQKLAAYYIERGNDAHLNLDGMVNGERQFAGSDSDIIEAIRVTYDAQTGAIVGVPYGEPIPDGRYRVIRTYLLSHDYELVLDPIERAWKIDWSKRPTFEIFLHYPPSFLSPFTIVEAMERSYAEDITYPEASQTRAILPEQVIEDDEIDWRNMLCPPVFESDFSLGDRRFRESVRQFNQQYAKPLADGLFGARVVVGNE